MMRIVFNSSDLPGHLTPAAKARAWAEAMEKGGVNIEASTSRTGFAARLTAVVLGELQVGSASATSLRVERSRRMLADGDDRIELLMSTGRGTFFARQRGREMTWSASAGVLLDNSEAHSTGAPKGGHATALHLPRARLGRAISAIENNICRPLAADNEAMLLLSRYIEFVLASDIRDPALIDTTARHLVDLVVLATGAIGPEHDEAMERGLIAGRLRAVLDVIDKRCHEPLLNAADIGAALGISARYVQHLLQSEARTLSEELVARRLDLFHARLLEHATHGNSIAEIAYACGFNELSTFYRAFRARYGCTPTELRDHVVAVSRARPD